MLKNCENFAFCGEFWHPKLQPLEGFERDNEPFCSLCNLAKFRDLPTAGAGAAPSARSTPAAPRDLPTAGAPSTPREPVRPQATTPAGAALEPRVLSFSRVFILAAAPLAAPEIALLERALASRAGLALGACSFSYATLCCPHSQPAQRALCAGFILSRIAASGAQTVLVLGKDAASGLLNDPKIGQILRAQVFNKAVKFVINYPPKFAQQSAEAYAAFADIMGFLRI